jgi:hypothetical protein
MNGRKKIASFLAGSLLLLGQMMLASAGTLTLDTGISLQLSENGSGAFPFSVTSGATPLVDEFATWVVSFQVIPNGLVSGTLSIGSGAGAKPIDSPFPTEFQGLTLAANNSIFTPATGSSFAQPSVQILASSGTINGLGTYIGMSADAVDDYPVIAANTSYGLGDLTFSVVGGTPGDSWTVYAIQQQGANLRSYWFDDLGNDRPYENIPFTSGGNYSIPLGTISVVPEPSSLVLAGSASPPPAGT